ncbi:COG2958 family protein [Paracoccus aerius]|uniref:HrgA protein n=1 Tax=Paracoccus aerius TaxID=1915382 RepID=A0ABS1SAS6_9RHOB|nr:HrgA protein [Paracoccus aerius]MBL3675630.1 HrgA protein [Paracoccus aerius]GHG35716.1 hypothetical protein GCM10017322_38220 [Paracoccus aerius]
MEKFSITRFVPPVLQELQGDRLTAREIAVKVYERHPEACEAKRQRSRAVVQPLDSYEGLIQQIVAEIGAQRQHLERRFGIKSTEERPRKYFYSTSSDDADVQAVEEGKPVTAPLRFDDPTAVLPVPRKPMEAELYPLLSQFLFSELRISSKRIDEKRSRNSRGPEGNKWLFPDVVGIENLTADWSAEVIDCAKAYSDPRSKLYSFEVKVLLNRSNVRQSYFQAVSNSSWANFPYLVTSEIHGDTLAELRVLAGTHGVGVIKVNADNPSESEILIPARERTTVDWNSANRIASENADFVEFLNHVKYFQQTGQLKSQDWDYASDVG